MLRRFENWRKLLAQEIAAKANSPFAYGVHDCCLSVADCVYAVTGVDLCKEFRGYRGEEAAQQILDQHGGVLGVAQYLAEKFNIKRTNKSRAGAGDVVILMNDGRALLAIIGTDGRTAFAASKDGGWLRFPKKSAIAAWKI